MSKESEYAKLVGIIPAELIDATIAEKICLAPYNPTVRYCIFSKSKG